ncbi:AraC family transcriptional regulator [Sphingobacterium sp. 40-24]|uniref:AraC family transcriptional regulator n=1 Tax=Sphingobacterium sp. 40-24 TaxID=1895843 RepID=UPI00095DCCD3|nr:AraC family transcriptional regulator [Sphingobacterium sp. 40-24]OJZ05769.1 MAG: AraC family transcriptional regulator [Sphingobacterium sp. 40-24]
MAKERKHIITEYHLNRHQPDKPQVAIIDLKSHLIENHCQVNKPHIHSFYQIIWFKKGKGTHAIDFNKYEVFENAIFFVAKDQVHYFDENTDYEGILIHFNEVFLFQNENPTAFFLNSNLFNNLYQQPTCCIDQGGAQKLDEYIAQMKCELEDQEDFGKEQLLRNYLNNFLIQIQRKKCASERHEGQHAQLFDEKRLQLIKFINLITENYKKGLTVAAYASLLGISSRSLSDLTQHLLNKTPSQMIQERIIVEAQRLLLYSQLNINQIGYQMGFDDASYFVKYFKKHTGISPSEFRKSIA